MYIHDLLENVSFIPPSEYFIIIINYADVTKFSVLNISSITFVNSFGLFTDSISINIESVKPHESYDKYLDPKISTRVH